MVKIRAYIGEATEYDKKETLEERRPKSWLKSVSAFANGNGGVLLFGVADDDALKGLPDVKTASEKISEAVKSKMDPIPSIELQIRQEEGKDFILLHDAPGAETPYYYNGDGGRIAYIRVGNESVQATSTDLKRLVLRGSNSTYDSLPTLYRFENFAFTKLRSVYRQRTGLELDAQEFVSFGLVDEKGFLTHAKAPNGTATNVQIGTIPSGGAGDFASTNPANALIDLVYALGAQYRANGTFVMNSKTAAAVRKMRDADGRFLWADSLAMGQPAQLLGYPVLVCEDMPDIAAGSFSIAFGDFRSAYTIVERPDLRVLRDPFSAKPHVLFYATKRVGGGVTDARAIKLMVFG